MKRDGKGSSERASGGGRASDGAPTVAQRSFVSEPTETLERLQRLAGVGALAGNVAHDFNNLLGAMLGSVENALGLLEPEHSARVDLETIRSSARHASSLCRQLLLYSRRQRNPERALNMTALVRSMSSVLALSAGHRNRVDYDLAEDMPQIRGDAIRLQQVLMNLVFNAADAIGEGPGTIAIRTGVRVCDQAYLRDAHGALARGGAHVFLSVTDSGAGMDDETRTHIFDESFSTKGAGRGMGLSIALDILRDHGGAIKVVSVPAVGSIFEVLFPALSEPE
jgi:signal transduction histidine kinase